MKILLIVLVIAIAYQNVMLVHNEKSSDKVKIQLVEYHNGTTKNQLLQSKYVLMSSVERIHGVYNYIFLTDLYGPHFVLLQSSDECKLSVDFDAIMSNQVNGSIKFVKYNTNVTCDMHKDTYVLMRMESLLDLDDNNKAVIHKKYDFDRGYSSLKITNHSTIGVSSMGGNIMDEFKLQFSNTDSNIKLDIGYYGKDHTLKQIPNIPVGPLVGLIEMQVQHLNVSKTSKLAVQMSFASSEMNKKFGSTLNRFFSDLQTPGVFRTYNISLLPSTTMATDTKGNVEKHDKNFLGNFSFFWKAIAYAHNPPRRSSQIMANIDSTFKCGNTTTKLSNRATSNITEIVGMMGLTPLHSYDCMRIEFITLNKDTTFFSTKYMAWSFTFGFTSYYSNVMPVSVICSVAVAYALPLIVGMVLFVLSKTTCRNKSPSIYTEISCVDDDDNDDNAVVNIDDESLYHESPC